MTQLLDFLSLEKIQLNKNSLLEQLKDVRNTDLKDQKEIIHLFDIIKKQIPTNESEMHN